MRKRGKKHSEEGGKYGTKVTEYFVLRIAALAAVSLSPLVVDKVIHQQPLNLWDLEVFFFFQKGMIYCYAYVCLWLFRDSASK